MTLIAETYVSPGRERADCESGRLHARAMALLAERNIMRPTEEEYAQALAEAVRDPDLTVPSVRATAEEFASVEADGRWSADGRRQSADSAGWVSQPRRALRPASPVAGRGGPHFPTGRDPEPQPSSRSARRQTFVPPRPLDGATSSSITPPFERRKIWTARTCRRAESRSTGKHRYSEQDYAEAIEEATAELSI